MIDNLREQLIRLGGLVAELAGKQLMHEARIAQLEQQVAEMGPRPDPDLGKQQMPLGYVAAGQPGTEGCTEALVPDEPTGDVMQEPSR